MLGAEAEGCTPPTPSDNWCTMLICASGKDALMTKNQPKKADAYNPQNPAHNPTSSKKSK